MEKAPTVRTDLGSLTGKTTYVKDSTKPVYTYLGIPYALPPVGNRRFVRPEPVQPWSGDRDATKPGLPSPQPLTLTRGMFLPAIIPHDATSEDCLYLNIHTAGVAPDDKRPVMFYIHGGGFLLGMGDMYDGTPFVTFGDVVIVTINYRLGPLGFLSTGDDACPGNVGLFDQLEALKWVNKHISNFGGDPDNVTIFGLSAGSMSVELMEFSPLSKGLFHKTIMQSGSSLLPKVVLSAEEARRRAFQLGQLLGCNAEDSKELVECLREKSTEEITNAQLQLFMTSVEFHPVVEGTYLPKTPQELYTEGQFHKVPHMTGFTDNEGLFFLMMQCPKAAYDTFSEEEAMLFMDKLFKGFFPMGLDKVLEIVKREYFPEDEKARRKDATYLKSRLSDVMGDMFIAAPHYQSMEYHSKSTPTYMYLYTHRPSYSLLPATIPGASHGEDGALGWGDPFAETSQIQKDKPYTKEEETLSRNLIKYFSNMAKHGNPNGEGLLEWPVFDLTSRKFFDMGTSPAVKDNHNLHKMALWSKTIKETLQNLN